MPKRTGGFSALNLKILLKKIIIVDWLLDLVIYWEKYERRFPLLIINENVDI